MEKVGRIISSEFDTEAHKNEAMVKFRSAMAELAEGIELLVTIDTSELSAITIQIWPDQGTLDAYELRRAEWFEKNTDANLRDRIVYDGDMNFWFQQIKYFGANAMPVAAAR
tara:strand:- start:431 stop:766 length:336 start_codon:yes stop_codon:yes gene_type:complete